MVKIDADTTAGVGSQGEGPGGQGDRVRPNLFRRQPKARSPATVALLSGHPAVRLSRIASLTAIVLLSVGLWAAIWAATSSLVAVVYDKLN